MSIGSTLGTNAGDFTWPISPQSGCEPPNDLVRWFGQSHNEVVIHLRVVSPPDVTTTLVPMLDAESAVMNLTVFPAAVRNPDGDAVHFDVLQGAANEVIGRLRDLGLEQRGSIVLENVDTSISALADRAAARRGRFQQFTPVWPEIEARIAMEGTFPPSWFALLVIAGLIGAIGILTNSQILIVGAMVVGPEYGAILSFAFGVTRRDSSRVGRSAAALVFVFISVTTIPAASDIGVSLAFGSDSEAWGSTLQLLLNVTVLAAVAIAGLPVQRALWQRVTRRAAAGSPD
jgi:hypothetical protein